MESTHKTPCFAITHIPKRYQDLCARAEHDFAIIRQFDGVGQGAAILNEFKIRSTNYSMTDGEVGCLLAHLAAWKHIQTLSCKFALVAEDDWIPPDNWKVHLAEIVSAAPKEADIIYLTRPSNTMWEDGRPATTGRSINVNTIYTMRECLPMYANGCMLISPTGASKLVGNIGGEHITLIPSDVLCWMSCATDDELQDAFQYVPGEDKHIKSYENIRLNSNFKQTTAWVIQRPNKYEKLTNGKYQVAQFGRTPIQSRTKSTTEKRKFAIRDALQNAS